MNLSPAIINYNLISPDISLGSNVSRKADNFFDSKRLLNIFSNRGWHILLYFRIILIGVSMGIDSISAPLIFGWALPCPFWIIWVEMFSCFKTIRNRESCDWKYRTNRIASRKRKINYSLYSNKKSFGEFQLYHKTFIYQNIKKYPRKSAACGFARHIASQADVWWN